jgi:ATP-dependent DNA ligase
VVAGTGRDAACNEPASCNRPGSPRAPAAASSGTLRAVPFIPPMLSSRLTDPTLLAHPRYVAEPKLDGQRAQVHVERGRTVAVYSRPGRELLRLRGLAWLRDLRWPIKAAVLDGELFSGEGRDGIDAILTARNGDEDDVSFAAFDVLQLEAST